MGTHYVSAAGIYLDSFYPRPVRLILGKSFPIRRRFNVYDVLEK